MEGCVVCVCERDAFGEEAFLWGFSTWPWKSVTREIGTTVLSRLWMVGRHVVTWEENGALKSGRRVSITGGLSCAVFLRKPESLFSALCSGDAAQRISASSETM